MVLFCIYSGNYSIIFHNNFLKYSINILVYKLQLIQLWNLWNEKINLFMFFHWYNICSSVVYIPKITVNKTKGKSVFCIYWAFYCLGIEFIALIYNITQAHYKCMFAWKIFLVHTWKEKNTIEWKKKKRKEKRHLFLKNVINPIPLFKKIDQK